MEKLGRGVVAVRTNSTSVYVGWRMLGADPDDIAFNLYRSPSGGAAVQLTTNRTLTTDFVDTGADLAVTNAYFVRPVLDGVEQAASASFVLPDNTPVQPYLSVPLQIPAGGTTPDGVAYTYSANDCSVGDVDGDGEFEIVVKWDPSNSQDNANSGYTGNVFLDAYKLNGTRLWRIDLGRNIRAGAHYTQFMVYDLDGDGKAELACKTAPGTLDGLGHAVLMPGDNVTNDYRNASGYILTGPEYLTIFSGQNGAALATTNYVPPRGTVSDWGDSYGNRVDRFLACVAYVDGQRPSLVMCRGYYTRAVLAAWNWRGGQLTNVWTFDSNNSGYAGYMGQGNHNLSVGDVDGDGKDEIVYGAAAIDHDGTGLYTTGLGHGDALHLSDMDPDRPGLEVWDVHETPSSAGGGEFRVAGTGQLLFGLVGTGDTGRGMASHIDPRYRGFQMWSSASDGVYDVHGNRISPVKPSVNFAIWWDGDLCRELLDGTSLDKWNADGSGTTRLLSASGYGAASINGTKANPCLSGDILGDWREEIIYRSSDNTRLLIFTTTLPATNRFYTFLHDPVYRLGIAWQNVAYNQPPHTGFYIGEDMNPPPLPPVSDARLVWRGGKANNAWDAGATTNWSVNGIWTNTTLAVFNTGDTVLFDLSGSNNPPVNLIGALRPGKTTVYTYAPQDYVFAGGGSLAGTTAVVKAGTGTLTVNTTNSYSGGTTIRDGTLSLGAPSGAGTGAIVLYGGTLTLAAAGSPATYSNALNVTVPSTITSPGVTNANQALSGTWSGSAPLNVSTDNGGTLSVQGDMSDFRGTIHLIGGGIFQFSGNSGSGSAAFDLGNGTARIQTRDGGNISLGSLHGDVATILRGAGAIANPSTYIVGANDASTTMSGAIADGTAGAGATVSVTKVGSGTWTLTGSNTYSGATTVSNGTLLVTGSLTRSPVTVADGSQIGGSGLLGQGLVVQNGGRVITGNGTNFAGTLTVSNGLSQLGGVVSYFDLSNDPTGTIKTNDLIRVVGNLTLTGANTILVNLMNGPLPEGLYTLIEYSGTLTGSLSNLAVSGDFDIPVTLTNLPGSIALVVARARPSATVTWVGDGLANNWDTGATSNWLNGAAQDRFYTLDTVRLGNSGSTNPPLNLVGSLKPVSVVVDATVDYTFAGGGSIGIPAELTKTNTGTLTILTTNDYTGATTLLGGVLAVSTMANGGVPSAIGASSSNPPNLVFSGGALRYLGPSVTVDRGAVLGAGGGTIEIVTSGTALTLSGATVAGGGALIKAGSGTLVLSVSNSYSGGTVLQNGTLRLGSDDANRYALGSGNVTFSNNAALQMYGYAASSTPTYGTLANGLVVPAGQAGTLLTPARCTVGSTLTGSGTLNAVWDYVRMDEGGNWSAFAGQINIRPRSGTAEFRIANTAGYPNAAICLSNGVTLYQTSGNGRTIDIGELTGDGGSTLGPGNGNSSNPTWRVGGKNTSATFGGRIIDAGVTAVTKVGSGTWTLIGTNTYSGITTISSGTLKVGNGGTTGTIGTNNVVNNAALTFHRSDAISYGGVISGTGRLLKLGNGTLSLTRSNTYSGGTTVSNGTLLVNNAIGSGTGTGAVTTTTGATLGGSGFIRGPVTIAIGGTLSPGNGVGTLTISNNLVVNNGVTLQYDLGASSDQTVVSSNLTLGGTLNVNNAGGFGAGTYVLFSYGKTLTYTGVSIGSVPAGFSYTISTSTPGQVRLLVADSVGAFQQWQISYFGSTNNPAAAPNADPLGKGMSNTNQFLAGLNPTNPASVFRVLSAVPQTADVVITWAAGAGRTNVVQATAGDDGGGYTNTFSDISGSVVLPGSGDVTTNYVDSGGATNFPSRYYRIRLGL